jgi:uncharacterized membrane protein YraQ (UPF0718 family)
MNRWGLLIPAAIMVALIVVAVVKYGRKGAADGFVGSGKLFVQVLPNLLIGFTIAGFLALLIPGELVAKWLGPQSGAKGLFAGTLAGMLTPGGPFTHFPILATLMGKGASVGPVCAYITAWALVGVHRILIWEAPILGWKFVLVRVAVSIAAAPVIGFLAALVSSKVLAAPPAPPYNP